MTILSMLATVFGAANGFAGFPQAYKIFKTKSAGDIALSSYSILFVVIGNAAPVASVALQ